MTDVISEPPVPQPTTMGEVNLTLGYIRRDLLTISNKLEGISSNFVTISDFTEHLRADADHEARIRVLEQAMWKYIGWASAVAAAISLVGSYVLQKIG